MTDDLQQLAQTALLGSGLGTAGGIARAIIFGAGGLAIMCSLLAASILVGSIIYLLLYGDHPTLNVVSSPAAKISVTVVASFFGIEVFKGLRVLANQFSSDPIGLLKSIWNGIRGK